MRSVYSNLPAVILGPQSFFLAVSELGWVGLA